MGARVCVFTLSLSPLIGRYVSSSRILAGKCQRASSVRSWKPWAYVARGPGVQKVRSLSELCGLRVSVETYVAAKGTVQCKRCQRFGHTQQNCGYAPRCFACGETHLSGECSTPKQQFKCYSCGGNHNYRGCSKWKEAKAALAKHVPNQRTRTSGAAVQAATNGVVPPQPSAG
jgi:hypothetical protein